MKRLAVLLIVVAAMTGVVSFVTAPAGQASGDAVSIFVTEIPPGYRDWKLISVAHEEGQLNDIRAILGNDTTVSAYREGKLPFPEGTIIARIAWKHVPSEENNKVFGPRVVSPIHGERLSQVCGNGRVGVRSIR
jgi:hypothetical protein